MRIRKSVQALLQFKMLKEKWKRAWAWINQVEDYTPDVFVKSQWQLGEASTLYLLYRWLVAVVFVCGILASWIDLGRNPRRGQTTSHYLKWPIYLTNWGFTLCTLQAILSTVHVTKHYAKVRRMHPDKVEMKKMKISFNIYWILHSMAVISAIVITTVYWAAVYNPKTDRIDGVNLTTHLFNSVLMMLDLWIVAHPFKLLHCYYWFILGSFYTMFSYAYFNLGGTDRKGHVYIYRIVDWRKPGNALVAIGGTVVFGAAVTVLLWVMSMFKRRLGNLFHQKMAARRTENTSQGTANLGPRIV